MTVRVLSGRDEGVDISLAYDRLGRLTVHRLDCPVVRQQAEDGEPIATLFGCQRVPEGYELHDCWEAP